MERLVPITRPTRGSTRFELQKKEAKYRLSDDELTEYRDKGFIIIRDIFKPQEVELLIEEADRTLNALEAMNERFGLDKRYNLRFRYDYSAFQGEQRLTARKIESITGASPMFLALSTDPRICDRLASIYDGYPPRLFNDMLSFKPPQSPALIPHQDANWWRGFAKSIVTVAVALNETTRANGCTEMWTGYKRGLLHNESAGGTIDIGNLDPSLLANERHYFIEMKPGDAVFFDSYVPHTAGINATEDYRRVAFLSYNDAREGEHYSSYAEHYRWYKTYGNEANRHEAEKYFFL